MGNEWVETISRDGIIGVIHQLVLSALVQLNGDDENDVVVNDVDDDGDAINLL